MTRDEAREAILAELERKVCEFLYDDRKRDLVLPAGSVETAVWSWTVSIAELTDAFSLALRRKIPPLTGRKAIEAPKPR